VSLGHQRELQRRERIGKHATSTHAATRKKRQLAPSRIESGLTATHSGAAKNPQRGHHRWIAEHRFDGACDDSFATR
jgi:hypothetical protein